MGRSGGSSGGSRGGSSGGSRSGGFGGSRSSGMRSSGGGRSSSGSYSRSSGSFSGGRSSSTYNHSRPTNNNFDSYSSSPYSSGGSPRPVRPIIYVNNSKPTYTGTYGEYGQQNNKQEPYHKGYRGPVGGPQVNVGCLYSFILIVALITLFLVVFGGLWAGFFGEQRESSHSDITYSTMNREPLPANAVTVKNGYYTDELGWIESRSTVESGMKSFYEDTGVMPYLYLTDEVDGETSPKANDFMNFANRTYDELFTGSDGQVDEAHVLVIFHEYYDGDYTVYYLAGVQAQSVVDDEAGEILLDYFDRYYYDTSKDNSEYFGAVFKEAGAAMMKVTRPNWYYPTIFAAVILILFGLLIILRTRAKNKKEQDKRDQEILNTPLQTFGDTETTQKAEELAKKYESNLYDKE